MELQDIYFVAEIVAAFAVIASLLFVGLQLRQNSNLVRVSNAQAGAAAWNEHAMVVAGNEDLAQAMINDAFPALMNVQPDAESFRTMMWSQSSLRTVETIYLQWRDGNLSDELWNGYRAGTVRSFAFSQSHNMVWAITRTDVSPDFCAYVDGLQKEGEKLRSEIAGATEEAG